MDISTIYSAFPEIEQNLISELFIECQNDINTLTDILIEISLTTNNTKEDEPAVLEENTSDTDNLEEDLVEISFHEDEPAPPSLYQRLFGTRNSNEDKRGNYIQLGEIKKDE